MFKLIFTVAVAIAGVAAAPITFMGSKKVSKPTLNLDFQSNVKMTQTVGNMPPQTSSQDIAMSSSLFKVAQSQTQMGHAITQISDLSAHNVLLEESFFAETVCYFMPLQAPPGSPSSLFQQMVAQVVLADAYSNATFQAMSKAGGLEVWATTSTKSQSSPQFNLSQTSDITWTLSKSGVLHSIHQATTQTIQMQGQPPKTTNATASSVFTKLVTPAPAAAFSPPKGESCANLTSVLPAPLSLPSAAAPTLITEGHFAGKTDWEYKQLLGTYMSPAGTTGLPLKEFSAEERAAKIPAAFDAATNWPQCKSIGTIRNQGQCGSCWAFGANEALEDRFCIASNGKQTPTLGPEWTVDCDSTDGGCQGGFLDNAWKFLQGTGAVAETCDPYQHCAYAPFANCTAPSSDPAPPGPPGPPVCPSKCADGSALKMFKAKSAYAVAAPGDVEGMQREIMTNGPIEVAFFVFSDFMGYTGGVYKRSPTAMGPEGGHAVKITGWGTDATGGDYWKVANSWSPSWGEAGYFRIARGTNECGIETQPAAGEPAL